MTFPSKKDFWIGLVLLRIGRSSFHSSDRRTKCHSFDCPPLDRHLPFIELVSNV